MKICICSSMAFYKQFSALKEELEVLGHEVIIPDVEFEIQGDDTSVGAFFDRYGGVDAFPPEHDIWIKRGDAITKHFRKIDDSDCILVVNHEKKGVPNYIGANTFLEIGYAFGTGKKIYILNDLPDASSYKEELLGMRPIVLAGDINAIK